MKPDKELREKLDSLVSSIDTKSRAQVEALITSVVDAGGTSERDLVKMVHNQSFSILLRLNVCWLAPRLRIVEAENVLEALMSDPSEQIREEAALGLGLVLKGDDVDVLHYSLEHDRSKSVRLAVLHALSVISSSQSAILVMGVLQNLEEDAELRADAAEALAHVKDERIVDVLIDSLQDNSPLVRYSAAYALGQQGDTRALPALREVASCDNATTPWGSVASSALDSIETIMAQVS